MNRLSRWSVLVIFLGVVAYALAEDLTLTTYYPAPRGVYRELRATDTVVIGATRGPSHGPLPASKLLVAGAGVNPEDLGGLIGDPCPVGSAWFDEDQDGGRDPFECRPPLIMTPAGQVGIGTTTPAERLEVSGNITLSGPRPRTVTNVDLPVNNTDVATKAYVDAAVGGGVIEPICPWINQNIGNCTPPACPSGYTNQGAGCAVNSVALYTGGAIGGGYCKRICTP